MSKESKKEVVKRDVTLTLNLTKVAKDFGYNLEVDSHDDVWHDGYSAKQVREMGASLPGKYDGAEKVFSGAVGLAMEDSERDSWAVAIRNERINALTEALERIDVGHAEYQDAEGDMISEPAAITSVEVDEKEDTITVTIKNPEHLINGIISGRGYFAADLSTVEKASDDELKKYFHHLNDYFEVYGASKPDGELSSQYSPCINDKDFEQHLEFRMEELTVDEAADDIMIAVDNDVMDAQSAMDLLVKVTKLSSDEVKKKIVEKAQQKAVNAEERTSFWKKNL